MIDLDGHFAALEKFAKNNPKTIQRQKMREQQKERTKARKAEIAMKKAMGIEIKQTEKELQSDMITHFLKKGYMVIRHNSFFQVSEESGTPMRAYIISNTGDSSGLSDITVGKDGRLAYIEVKTGYNKQTDSQKKFEGICNKYGMPYCVAYSIEQADEFINKIFNN